MRYLLNFPLFLILASCGAPNEVGGTIALSHKDFESNFDGFASACFDPLPQTDRINCSKTATFAHYTLTLIQPLTIGEANYKVLFKKKLYETNGSTCIGKEIKPDSIRIFNRINQKAVISDEDIEIHDEKIMAKVSQELFAHNNSIGEACYRLTLINGESPLMRYKVKLEGISKQETSYLGFFSSGSPIYFK